MKRTKWIPVVIAVLVLTAVGCGGMSASAPSYDYAQAELASEPMAVGSAPMADEEGAYSGAGESRGMALNDTAVEQMVIHTGDLDLIVPDTEQAIDHIQGLIDDLEGYVVSMNTYQYDRGVQASMTLRVPAESFDAALADLRDLASTVVRETVSGQDVTEEYVDLQSRLRHLRAKEEQLLEFLDSAEDTEAVLAVYEQLTYAQADIELVTGRMEYLQNQASMATITVSLTPDALAQPLEVTGWNLSGTAREALEALLDVLEVIVKGLIYIAILLLPTLLVIALPIAGVVWVVRRVVQRVRDRRTAKAE